MVLVLVMGMVVSFAIRSWIEGGVITAVVSTSDLYLSSSYQHAL